MVSFRFTLQGDMCALTQANIAHGLFGGCIALIDTDVAGYATNDAVRTGSMRRLIQMMEMSKATHDGEYR